MLVLKHNATKTADKAHYYTRHQKEMNRQLLGLTVSQNSIIGTDNSYGLDGPGVESRWGATFCAPIRNGFGVAAFSCTESKGLFLRGKAARTWRSPPTPSSAEVKERVELYFYSPSGLSRQNIG
jgi:hypothetical protein